MENKSETKEDFIYLLILLIIASISGIYLLLTTNIIAKDGVFYINQARAFPEEPLKIIRSVTPPGYPILIWLVHSLTALISPNVSTTGWIYSARFISLFSRVLTVVPLYFIGKKLLGQINSFWGILLLLLLPYPTRFGSDALRDWPYMLFLATGFLLLLHALKQDRYWLFATAGLVSGLGYWIRNECIELIACAFLCLLISFIFQKNYTNSRKLVLKLIILVSFFAAAAGPYMLIKGTCLPERLEDHIKVLSGSFEKPQTKEIEPASDKNQTFHIGFTSQNLTRGFYAIVKEMNQMLYAWHHLPALLIGMYFYFRKKTLKETGVLLISIFIFINIATFIAQYCSHGNVRERYMLAFICTTIFYVPAGFHVVSSLIQEKIFKVSPNNKPNILFLTLILLSCVICIPGLPNFSKKTELYIVASQWLKEHSPAESLIIAADPRISFYAERRDYRTNETKNIKLEPVYLVKVGNEEIKNLPLQKENFQLVFSYYVRKPDKNNCVEILKFTQGNNKIRSTASGC